MNRFVRFLAGVGHVLGKVFVVVKENVPEDLLITAINLAANAATKPVDNVARREWVVGQLERLPGVSESAARLATEMAVAALKKEAAVLAGKGIKAVTTH